MRKARSGGTIGPLGGGGIGQFITPPYLPHTLPPWKYQYSLPILRIVIVPAPLHACASAGGARNVKDIRVAAAIALSFIFENLLIAVSLKVWFSESRMRPPNLLFGGTAVLDAPAARF